MKELKQPVFNQKLSAEILHMWASMLDSSAYPSYTGGLGRGGIKAINEFTMYSGRSFIGGYDEYGYRFLSAAADVAEGGFESLLNDRGPVTFMFDGKEVESEGYMAEERRPSMTRWQNALFLSQILRREKLQSLLEQVEYEHLEGDAVNETYYQTILDTWGGFSRSMSARKAGDEAAASKWSAAWRAASQRDELQNAWGVKPKFLATWLTMFPAMEAIEDGDASRFNEALYEVLKAYKAYYGRGKEKNHPRMFVALGATSLAALAFDKGMPIEVESGYMPKWLISGTWPEGDASTERANRLAEEAKARGEK